MPICATPKASSSSREIALARWPSIPGSRTDPRRSLFSIIYDISNDNSTVCGEPAQAGGNDEYPVSSSSCQIQYSSKCEPIIFLLFCLFLYSRTCLS